MPVWRAAGQGAESMGEVSIKIQAIGAAEVKECKTSQGAAAVRKHEMTDHSIVRVAGVVHTCLRLLLSLLWSPLPVPPFCLKKLAGFLLSRARS